MPTPCSLPSSLPYPIPSFSFTCTCVCATNTTSSACSHSSHHVRKGPVTRSSPEPSVNVHSHWRVSVVFFCIFSYFFVSFRKFSMCCYDTSRKDTKRYKKNTKRYEKIRQKPSSVNGPLQNGIFLLFIIGTKYHKNLKNSENS